MFFHLKPRDERRDREHVDQVIARFRPLMNSLPGMRAFPQNPPAIRIGGTYGKGLYQYTMMSTSIDDLYRGAMALEKELLREPGLQDVATDLQIKSPQMNVVINRDKAAAVKVTPEQIENGLYAAYGPRWISTIYAPDNQYRVLIEVDRRFQTDASKLTALYIRSSDGNLVPLDSVTALKPIVGPQSISHYGQLPAVTLSFNLAPRTSIGDAVGRIEEIAQQTLPDTVTTTFQGTAQAFQSSLKSLWMLLALAILVVYIVLGILYESFIHPITILSGLPSAGFGALLTLWLFGLELNIYSFVGLILLIGIVKKNAIMQIDFALDAERNQGMAPLDAIYQGCLIRFRPIMMTTMAALLGAVPIALGYGAGGEARQPLGLCVVGGLLFSQLVTLYLTPVFYVYLSNLKSRFSRRVERMTEEEPEVMHAGR